MKRSDKFRRVPSLLMSAILLSLPMAGGAEVVFSDAFSSSDLSKTMGKAKWTNRTNVEVVSNGKAISGQESAKFRFPGNQDPDKDSWAELRFDLGNTYPELWIQYYLFVPENYEHRGESWSNNKFLRLWARDYKDREKVGFSLLWRGDGGSDLNSEWSVNGGGLGTKIHRTGAGDAFITTADQGKWIKVRVQAKAAQSGDVNGTLRLWKNDELIIDHADLINNFHLDSLHAYQFGYILGWANSGFDEQTEFYLDDVVIATSVNDLEAISNSNSLPNPPTFEVN